MQINRRHFVGDIVITEQREGIHITRRDDPLPQFGEAVPGSIVEWKHVRTLLDNWTMGKAWNMCLPVYELPKEEIVAIVAALGKEHMP